MIKWLCKIEVTSEPSDNFYHFRDNRIMPPHVTSELAEQEGWWEKPEYIFNELNINSAISSPAHDEKVAAFPGETYTVKGYAYTGGGRAITRVEVSVDGGHNWRLAKHEPAASPCTARAGAGRTGPTSCPAGARGLRGADVPRLGRGQQHAAPRPHGTSWAWEQPWFRIKTHVSPKGPGASAGSSASTPPSPRPSPAAGWAPPRAPGTCAWTP